MNTTLKSIALGAVLACSAVAAHAGATMPSSNAAVDTGRSRRRVIMSRERDQG